LLVAAVALIAVRLQKRLDIARVIRLWRRCLPACRRQAEQSARTKRERGERRRPTSRTSEQALPHSIPLLDPHSPLICIPNAPPDAGNPPSCAGQNRLPLLCRRTQRRQGTPPRSAFASSDGSWSSSAWTCDSARRFSRASMWTEP